jgi:6-phosphogluconolactonase
MHVYVGAYTEPPQGRAKGIGVYEFDTDSGELHLIETVQGPQNPSFLALDSDKRLLSVANEVDEGYVTAFSRDPETGKLTLVGRESSGGAGPCYVSFDGSGRFALVANYVGGTVAALPVDERGNLQPASSVVAHQGSSVNQERQQEPHPHMIAPSPDGRFVLAADLGTDEIVVYRLSESGQLERGNPGAAKPGAGPRHFAFGPDGRRLYVLNELDSTLTVYDFDGERGEMKPRQTVSALPDDFEGESWCAHVVVSSDGRFVYGSNRGHDSIAIWSIDSDSGEVSLVAHESTQGETPRNFAIDPSGNWLLAANQDSDTIVSFRRDAESGRLTPVGNVAQISSPVTIVFA